MKKLITIIMSFQLILAPVMLGAPASAFAVDDDHELSEEEIKELEDEAKTITEDAEKKAQQGAADASNPMDNVEGFREGDGKGADFYLKQILAIGTSCIGANILVSCVLGNMQTSLYLFMAGSLTHITGEILGAREINDKHQRSAKNLALKEQQLKEAAGSGELQRETIQAAINEETQIRDFVNKRKKWMIAVSVMYWAAVAMSIIETWWSFPPPVGTSKDDGGGCTGNVAPALATRLGVTAAYGFAAGQTSDHGAIKYGLGPIMALASVITSVGQGLSQMYNKSYTRAITFGISAGLATWIAVELGKKEEELNKNIDKLNAVLAELDKATDEDEDDTELTGSSSGGQTGGLAAGGGGGDYSGNDNGGNDQVAQQCWSQSSEGASFGENCTKKMDLKKPNFDMNMDIPLLRETIDQSHNLTSGLINGGAGKVDGEIAALGAKAGRMRELVKSLKKKLNDNLKKNGKKPFDFDGDTKKMQAQLMQDFNKGLSGAGLATGGKLASLDLDAEGKKDGSSGPTGALESSAAGAVAAGAAAGDLVGFTGIEDSTVAGAASGADTPSLSESLNDFETNVSDINNQSHVSIFALISNRYVMSYGRVMKKKEPAKAAAPAKAPPKKK